jgi:predicted MFS family arabinose efflux permease
MRRIQLAVGLGLFMDAALYVALIPLLPYYSERFGLSKLTAGLVLAAYPLLVLVTALPAGVVSSRVGGRRVTIAGSIGFAVSTIAFALAPDAGVLALARGLQGIASGMIWSAGIAWLTSNAPPANRGRFVGRAMAGVAVGAIAGPALGALAGETSPEAAFLVAAGVAALAAAASFWAPRGVDVPPDSGLVQTTRRALRQPYIVAAMALAAVDSVSAAVVDLLATLELGRRGLSAGEIGATLVVGSALGALTGLLGGRYVEQVGAARFGLGAGTAMAAVTAAFALPLPTAVMLVLLVVLAPLFTILMTGLFALAAAGSDSAGMAHGTANALTSLTWSAGWVVGPVVGGAIARAAGDDVAYVLAAAAALGLVTIALRATGGRQAAPVAVR